MRLWDMILHEPDGRTAVLSAGRFLLTGFRNSGSEG